MKKLLTFIVAALSVSLSSVYADEPIAGTECVKISASDFKDYANGDYLPVLNGALYNAGVEIVGAPQTDLAGKPRVVGGHVDIGCYEMQQKPGLTILIR